MDAAEWDARYGESELVWSAEPNVFVEREAAGLAPGRALDLAAGEGRNALWLASRGWEVEAVDFSGVALEKGRALARRHGQDITWTRADLTHGPPLAAADLVVIAYLQLEAGQLDRVLRWGAGLVADGGTMLVVAHAARNLTEGWGGPPRPEVLSDPDTVASILAEAGLEVEHAGEVLREVEAPEGPRHAIDLLVRARR